jgi:hypothetical protein
MSVEGLVDDWHGLDLTEEAVVVDTPDGRIDGYARWLRRRAQPRLRDGLESTVTSTQTTGDGASAHSSSPGVSAGRATTCPRLPATRVVVVQHEVNAANKGARQLLESAGYAPVSGVYVMETELDEARHNRAGPQAYPSAPSSPAGMNA